MNLLRKIFGKKDHPSNKEIKNYLEGNLDKEKTREVEKSISQNPLLSDAVDGFSEFGTEEMAAVPDFDTFYQKRAPKGKTRNIRQFINWLAAALLALFLLVALYLYWSESSTERIFADKFTKFNDPSISEKRNGENSKGWSSTKKEAMIFFREKDYQKSILYLEKHLAEDAGDIQSKFYLGLALLNEDDPSKAIGYLIAIAGENSDYTNDAKWYLALAQLKTKDRKGARETLEDLQKTGGEYYAKEAESILEQL